MNAVSSIERQYVAQRRIWIAAAALLAVSIHSLMFVRFDAGDVIRFVVPWYEHILATGRIDAFADPFGNYSPPYLYLLSLISLLDGPISPYYLVKLLSWVGAVWMLFAASRLLGVLGTRGILALFLVLLPSFISNVSMFGQADMFWVAPCILAVSAAVKGRWVWVAIWSGLAFSFKAQAAFLAPFVLHLFVTRKVPPYVWLVAPGVYLAAMLSAWLAGWPAWDLATIYLRQAAWQPQDSYFISNGASWWTIYGWLLPRAALETFWIGFALALAAVAAALAFVPKPSARTTMLLATISAAGLPFLLPGMHERFYLLADILAFLYALAYPSRRSIAAAILMQFASAFPVYVWAFELEPLQLLSPPCAIAALFLFLREVNDTAKASSLVREPGALASV